MEKPVFKLAHVGLNGEYDGHAKEITDTFCQIFGFGTRELPNAFFCDDAVEVVKKNGRGQKGHIGFYAESVEDALEYLRVEKGIGVIEDSKQYTEDGKLRIAYVDYDFFGFAVHISRMPKKQ